MFSGFRFEVPSDRNGLSAGCTGVFTVDGPKKGFSLGALIITVTAFGACGATPVLRFPVWAKQGNCLTGFRRGATRQEAFEALGG